MNCTFFGHKDCPSNIKQILKNEIIKCYLQNNVRCFYVGNDGNFDLLVQSILFELSTSLGDLDFTIVLSRPDENIDQSLFSHTYFPPCLDNVPPRFRISKRNEWLINNSYFIITYTARYISNTYKWVRRGYKKGLKITNAAPVNINYDF